MRQLNYKFESQNTWFLDPPLILESGDHFQLACQFNSMSRDTPTLGGSRTIDEMCGFNAFVTSTKADAPLAEISVDLCPASPDNPPQDCSFPCVTMLKPGWYEYAKARGGVNAFAPVTVSFFDFQFDVSKTNLLCPRARQS